MKPCYLIHAKRTPVGKWGGGLASTRIDDLLGLLLRDFVESHPFDPLLIDDVVVGCANQAGEDNRNLARMALLLAGLPHQVPGTTINRLCASSLDALIDACGRIHLGLADCVLVGGAEGMTRSPWVLSKSARPFGRDSQLYDTTFGWRFPNPKMEASFPLYSMGETAENVATKLNISREEQDLFALQSHQKALRAQEAGEFDREILPVTLPLKRGEEKAQLFERDEGPRRDTDLAKLSRLPPVFREGGSVTAGNSSSINDGAALLAVVSEHFLTRHQLTPLLEITGFGVRGVHPNLMGLGPVEAIRLLCQKYRHKIEDFDVIELNEAFAAQMLGCLGQLGLDGAKVNLRGGAIALGHPLGCSGARILTTLAHIMLDNPKLKCGLASMCVGVGQGVAVSVRSC